MTRLDILLTEKYNIPSRTKAQALIKQGNVFVDGKMQNKPSIDVLPAQKIELTNSELYVSRGAYKLLCAYQKFSIDVNDKTVLDIGASTGGFTQVSLLYGAKKVYALDIGKNELDFSIASNKRVKNLCETDIRSIAKEDLPDVDFITCDLSFISLTKILPHLYQTFEDRDGVFLFKPQFECGKELAKKFKGVIKDKKIHVKLLTDFINFLQENNIPLCNITYSSIKGGDGNIEYLIYISNKQAKNKIDIKNLVENAFKTLK